MPYADILNWIVIPVLIFLARIADVSIGTMRIISIAKGKKLLAPVFGFFELLLWLFAIGQIMKNLDNPLFYVPYALGFAAGTFVGMHIEEKVALGTLLVRIITKQEATDLIQYLNSAEYGVTAVNAQGARGPVHVIFSIIKRSDLNHFVDIIKRFNPNAFYSVEDIRYVREGTLRPRTIPFSNYLAALRGRRKGK